MHARASIGKTALGVKSCACGVVSDFHARNVLGHSGRSDRPLGGRLGGNARVRARDICSRRFCQALVSLFGQLVFHYSMGRE